MTNTPNNAGFTLVEMLVALGAMSLIAGAGVMMTDFGARTRDTLNERQAEATDLLRLRAALKSDLTQAAPRRARAEGGAKPQTALLGPPIIQGETFLSLVRRGWDNPTSEDRSSLQYVEYSLVDEHIERTYRRHVDGTRTEPPQILIDGVRSIRVRYLQYDQWNDAWSGSASIPLPDAVRLDIELQDRGSLSQLFLLPEFGR